MPRLLTPSRDAEADVPPAAPHLPADPLGRRFRRGNLVHALLQTLPEMEPARRADAALRFLARPGHGLDLAERTALLEEVLSVLQMPELTAAFGPGSLAEAPIAARFGDGQMVIGVVDRLLVEPRQVLVLDYKTNRPPPSRVEETPPAYLRQMALYRHALRLAFPGRPVRCALVWTYAARAVLLPDGLLDTHAPAGVA
jgi:ATP-dependent helicase/nuclease subunit A